MKKKTLAFAGVGKRRNLTVMSNLNYLNLFYLFRFEMSNSKKTTPVELVQQVLVESLIFL